MERLRRILCVGLMAGGCLVTLPATFVSGQQVDQREKLLSNQRTEYRKTLESLEAIPERRMSQIVQLRVEQRQLSVHTTLHAPVMNRRADVQGMSFPITLTYTESAPGEPDSGQFELELRDYPDAQSSVTIHLSCQPNTGGAGDLSIASSLQTKDRFARVQYTQTQNRAFLQAFGSGSEADPDSQSVTLAEKDFATLRERHPVETEKWLRPVLHRLQQDLVFATDSNAAWQALADEWPANDRVKARVDQLVPDLNSTRWKTRSAAVNNLAKLGRDGATVVLRMNRTGLSLEQNSQLDQLLSRFRPLAGDDVKALATDPDFLLDCEYSDDLTVRRLALARLQRILNRPLHIDVTAPDVVRGDAIERLRADVHTPNGASPKR